MHPEQLLILLTAICFCALLAHRLTLASPVAFLLGGIALAFIPGLEDVVIDPESMLVIFLPPILMEAAFFTSIRDFRDSIRAILSLAVGLVVATSAVVAAVAVWLIPGMSWALGFLLGAIVSPPDAAAAIGAIKGINLPKRVVSILEGESLVNDASGIVVYKLALAAVLVGGFSWVDASTLLAWKLFGGLAIGLAIGYAFVKIYPFLRDPSVEILTTFLPPYAAFMIAEAFDMSGVLAVVAAGLYVGWHAPQLFKPRTRISAEAVWKMVVFFLNALAFLLIGLQLPELIERLHIYQNPQILLYALAICVASVVVRFVWVYGVIALMRLLHRIGINNQGLPSWQNAFVVAWTGMRGVVTLALALALPLTLADGTAFPHRDLIMFLGVSVILFTLLVQGLSLRWITRKLSLSFDMKRINEEWHARVEAARSALARLDALQGDSTVHTPALARICEHYTERLESLGDGPNTPLHPEDAPGLMSHPLLQAENRLWAEALGEERKTLLRMRRAYAIGDDVVNDILREMDLLAARFHHEESESAVIMASIDCAEKRRALWQRLRPRRVATA